LNALAAFAAGSALKVSEDKLFDGLHSFTGTKRRFELRGEVAGIKVIDDYGHHPTEIKVTLAAAKNLAQAGKVYVIFQPHRYSRTVAFAHELGKELNEADFTFLLEIYAASEKPISGASSLMIANNMTKQKVVFEPSMIKVVAEVVKIAKSGDVIITLGAGNVNSLAQPILQAISDK
jgi:UDP-N-acetylmuramate--alanine ligase